MHELPWRRILLVTSEVIFQTFSQLTKSQVKSICKSPHKWQKIVINGNEYFILFLTRHLRPERTIPLSIIIDRPFRHCCQGRTFLTKHCDANTVNLWRHANAGCWHCDVIVVDWSCAHKLTQRLPLWITTMNIDFSPLGCNIVCCIMLYSTFLNRFKTLLTINIPVKYQAITTLFRKIFDKYANQRKYVE